MTHTTTPITTQASDQTSTYKNTITSNNQNFEISVTSLVLALLLLLGWVIKTLFRRWARIRRRRRGDTVPKETAMEMERRRLQERERGRQPLPPPQMGPPPRAAPCPAPPQMGPPPRAAPCPAHPVAPTPPPARGGGRYHLRPAKR
uniref:Uncharacterized protein n=1 Tax=Magallana gigas TaxID=29159 RepID=A0A8W8MHB1_MAGGI